MYVTTKIVWDYRGVILEKEGYLYDGPIEHLCGASQQQEQYYNTLINQANTEFGNASKVFNDLYSAMSPIVAAGPNQQGYSATELNNLNQVAIGGTSQAYNNAAKVARESSAAAGGSNFIPSGATLQTNAAIAGSAAQQESSELSQIQSNNYAQGRENYFTAAGDLAGATGTFNPATAGANAATEGGNSAANTANQIAQENNSWVQAVTGAIGGVAGSIATGGMSNLGKGVGFFGQNAPAPK